MSASLRTQARLKLETYLPRIGFDVAGPNVFRLPLSREVDGWLGIPERAEATGDILLHANIGLHDRRVVALLSELAPAIASGFVATAATNLGALSPDGKDAWWLKPLDNWEAEIDDLATRIRDVGLPFIERLSHDLTATEALVQQTSFHRDVLLPLHYLVGGKRADAVSYVANVVDRLPAAGEWARFYREFAGRMAVAART